MNQKLTKHLVAKKRTGMPQIDIIERVVRRLPLGSGTYLDRTMRGFMVVSNAASMTYVLQRKIRGRSVRVTLGRVGEISANEARDAAMATWLQMKQGINPNEQKREQQVRGMTLKEAFNLFMSSAKRSAKTIKDYNRWMHSHLSGWQARALEEIGNDRTGVRKLHERITADSYSEIVRRKAKCQKKVPEHSGQAMANNVLGLLKGVYNRARLEVPSLPEDPTVNVNWHPHRVRDSSLTVDDLPKWFTRVEKLSDGVKRDYWISVILTGGRRNQIAESQWEHLDFRNGTWHFPQPKGGTERAYTIPVSKYLLTRLKKRKNENDTLFPGSPWVFPSGRGSASGHINAPRNDKQGLPGAHSLRHTFRTHALVAGVSDLEAHLLMNHRVPGVNADYISRSVTIEHLRVAQEKISGYFLRSFKRRG